MIRIISDGIRWMLVLGLLQGGGQAVQQSIARNGYVSGEDAVFRFDGTSLSIRYGSNRSGPGIMTDWYAYDEGEWRVMPQMNHVPELPEVHLGDCDRSDESDISNRFPRVAKVLPQGSRLKHLEALDAKGEHVLAIFSTPAPNTQIHSLLEISMLSLGETPRVLAIADIGESRYCSAKWDAHKDGTKDLVVFTLEPAGSSVSYAFQSFTIHK
jgi:hypothetical protein